MALDPFLDPLPSLLTIQFEGEEQRFVPGAGAIFTEMQMDLIVANIVKMVRKKGKPGVLRWQEASNGKITHHGVTFNP